MLHNQENFLAEQQKARALSQDDYMTLATGSPLHCQLKWKGRECTEYFSRTMFILFTLYTNDRIKWSYCKRVRSKNSKFYFGDFSTDYNVPYIGTAY